MEIDKFTNALARAQELILDENFNRIVESKAKGVATGGGVNSLGDTSALEAQVFGFAQPQQQYIQNEGVQRIQKVQSQPRDLSQSKLPKAILESVKQQPLMSGDNMSVMTNIEQSLSSKTQQIPIQEQKQIPMQMPVSGGIDYNALKYIINECIKENLASIKKGMLNESNTPTFKGMKLCSGNKIQFLDSKGNLYEGVLKLTKKITK